MDKQSSKKPFFIMPEWAWAIVVGMFMLLLFLNHVIPGHAANLYPLTPDHLGYAANYVSHITVKGGELYVGGTYIANVGLILQESEERIAQFEADADSALSSLFSQIPKEQTYFALADDSAYGSVLVWLRSFLDDRDIQYFEIIIDYEDPFWYPQQWPDNWRDAYSESIYSLGPYSIYVYVRKILLAPSPSLSPSPVPENSEFGVFVKNHDDYYLYLFHGAPVLTAPQPPVINGSPNNALSYAVSTYSLGTDFIQPVTFSSGGSFGNMRLFYIPCSSVSDMVVYSLGTSVISYDIEYIKSNYSGSQQSGFVFDSSLSLLAFRVFNINGWGVNLILPFNLPSFYNAPSLSYNFSTSSLLVYSSTAINSTPLVTAYRYGLSGAETAPVPTLPPGVSPTPEPTSTPAPLPTAGESVHVILPTGTPSPTPPFSVPGGSNGEPGSGSPGSVGSGISAAQSSGILTYFSSFLSNNPALAFIAACFPAIPSEILYPLFILLFILMILAAIRLFVHFAGG